jgi:uncharacterized protein (TIGR01244 family)
MLNRIILALVVSCAASCASAPPTSPGAAALPLPATPEPGSSYYLDQALHQDRVFVAGQLQPVDVSVLKSAGISRVVNLRTPEEMASLDFDEAQLLGAAGLKYLNLPLGGKDYPYSPALLQSFAEQMEQADGAVLLHCASGGRAGLVYAAWLVQYRGISPDQAMRSLESTGGWPLPLEKLLGRRLSLQFAEP